MCPHSVSYTHLDVYKRQCQEIRRVSKAPILFLTSASDNVNVVMAMQLGGDDLLAKPFDLQVLSAKVQALLRRAYDFGPSSHLLSCGAAVLNVSDGTLDAHGQRVELTRNECRILQLLLEHKGEIVSRDALMTRLWESDSFVAVSYTHLDVYKRQSQR